MKLPFETTFGDRVVKVLTVLLGIWSVVVFGLATQGCSAKLYLLPPRANMPPPGIPRGAWNLCFDHVERVLNQARADAVRQDIVSNREWECARTYLIEACGRFLANNGHLQEMWRPDEAPYNFMLFRDHMRAYGENCEDEGYDTPFVRDLVKSFWDSIEREARACPTLCPVP